MIAFCLTSLSKKIRSANHGDFRDDLTKDGFAVIKGVIPPDRVTQYRERAKDWLLSFDTELDFEDNKTWTENNLPVQNKIRTFAGYYVSHEKFMWDARMEPTVLETFATLWGTDELLVSFDSLNITFPN